jgi:2,3-bisphosphoglycerate-independent phosphoglycerate mutase
MDRDQRWERVKIAYDLMVHGTGEFSSNALATLSDFYANGVTDEFMKPIRLSEDPCTRLVDNAVVLNANFRTDRGRQITRALCLESFAEYGMAPLNLNYYTLTQYDETFDISGVIFENDNLSMTLGEVVANAGLSQLRAAETEKYPHVTFFFSGGREDAFLGEIRWMESSPKVATYDLQPEMSAVPLTENVIRIIQEKQPDFICLNYANPDMVGHTGVYEAIVKAVETVDACLGKLIQVCTDLDYEMIVIADHGNADFAENSDGSPNTAHSTNPVPIWWITESDNADINSGKLADVAPSILGILGLDPPKEMTGTNLLIRG